MTDLQLGLLALGGLVIAGVFAYNRTQERRARREAEAAFRSSAGDALLEPSAGRRQSAGATAQRAPAVREVAVQADAPLPDARVDYVVALAFSAPAPVGGLCEQWKPYAHLYAKRALLAYSPDGSEWRPLSQGESGAAVALQAGLQLATREGAVGEAELIEFRAAADAIAAASGASVSAPDLRQAVERARELDRFCAEVDVQVVLHVMPAEGAAFDAARVRQLAQVEGLSPGNDGRYCACDAAGHPLYAVGLRDGSALAAGGDAPLHEGLSLTLDVARAPETRRTFQAMAAAARRLASSLEGRLVDDNGQALDERLLAAIEAQLGGVRAAFDARGFAPGSALARRLFS